MSDVKNLKEMAEFILDIANGIAESLKDGKVSLSDAYNFKDAVFSALPAFQGLYELDDEYFDLTENELKELKSFVSEKLSLESDFKKVELIAELVLNVLLESHNLIAELVAIKAKP